MKKKIAIIAVILFMLVGSLFLFTPSQVSAEPGCEKGGATPPPAICNQ